MPGRTWPNTIGAAIANEELTSRTLEDWQGYVAYNTARVIPEPEAIIYLDRLMDELTQASQIVESAPQPKKRLVEELFDEVNHGPTRGVHPAQAAAPQSAEGSVGERPLSLPNMWGSVDRGYATPETPSTRTPQDGTQGRGRRRT